MLVNCRRISKGVAQGFALVSSQPISFFGMVDPKSGIIVDKSHELLGRSIARKVLIFPHGKGSTVGSYIIYQLARERKAPAAMICEEAEPIVAVGAIIAGIPMVDHPESFDFKTGEWVRVDADGQTIETTASRRNLAKAPQRESKRCRPGCRLP